MEPSPYSPYIFSKAVDGALQLDHQKRSRIRYVAQRLYLTPAQVVERCMTEGMALLWAESLKQARLFEEVQNELVQHYLTPEEHGSTFELPDLGKRAPSKR